MKLFLLAGQSNLAGRAPGAEAGAAAGESAIRMDYVCSFARDVMTPHRSQGCVPLGVSPEHEGIVCAHFGPEIGFGRGLVAAGPREPMVFIKHGRGATNLAEDWHPFAATGKLLYRDFIDQARAAQERMDAAEESYEIEALIWCQGEGDATRREWAEAYEENLQRLFEWMRADLNCPDMPILLVLTGDGKANPAMADAEIVRQAQRNVASADSRVTLVDADDLTLLDHVHYDAPSQLKLGHRLADEYLRLMRDE